jgi:cobalt-zinc-cadmium efflux system outer membrane protein
MSGRRSRLWTGMVIAMLSSAAAADDQIALPSPLRAADVARIARARRPEVVAAQARARAAAERPEIVSALEDPTVLPSIDHLPFALGGANVSLTVEQRFPLSHVRAHRRDAAEAEARRELAEIDRVGLDIELDAAKAFWMLAETRAVAKILDEQRALADQVTKAATARYAASTGPQADVLRARLEVERLDGERRAFAAEVRAAEAMLDTSLARSPDAPLPELDAVVTDTEPLRAADVMTAAVGRRPELRADRAEIARSEADLEVMHSMYVPMAMVRTGPNYMMTDGAGLMLMVGITIPLWRGKLRAGVAEATATVAMANAELDATRRVIAGEAVAGRERVVAARARYLALRDDIVPRATEVVTSTLAAYAAGQLPLVSAIDAARALWSTQRELIEAQAMLGLAWARLQRTTGNAP